MSLYSVIRVYHRKFLACLEKKKPLYFEIILNVHNSCKDSTESSYTPLTQLFLMLVSYITIGH